MTVRNLHDFGDVLDKIIFFLVDFYSLFSSIPFPYLRALAIHLLLIFEFRSYSIPSTNVRSSSIFMKLKQTQSIGEVNDGKRYNAKHCSMSYH